jgi:hypothetical protein
MSTREQLHAMIDQLPDVQLSSIETVLRRFLEDPVRLALMTAPDDDEPLTDEDVAALNRSYNPERHRNLVDHEEVLSEFGQP